MSNSRRKINLDDFIGKQFGRLTIISPDIKRSKETGRKCVTCKCSCGTIKSFYLSPIINNKTFSCGCFQRESAVKTGQSKHISLVGNKYGSLEVVNRSDSRGHHTYYMCLCDCGIQTEVYSGNLTKGHTTSCGCKKRGSKTHGFIYALVCRNTNNIKYVGQTVEFNVKHRLRQHWNDKDKSNTPKNQWLRILSNPPIIKILRKEVPVSEINEVEKFYIEEFGRKINLLNTTHQCRTK